jgi:hypothetical protein
MDIFPNVEMLPEPMGGTRRAQNLDTAIAVARHFLYVQEGSEKDRRLRELAPRFFRETPSGVEMCAASERPQGVVWWRTAGD